MSVAIHAVDADHEQNAKVRYSIEGGSTGTEHFGIDSVTGQLTVSKPFDKHVKASNYKLTIVARDLGESFCLD